MTASPNKLVRSTLSGLPNTFCVLILLIRIGVRAVLKLVKLIPAINRMTKGIANSICIVCRLAFGMESKETFVRKCNLGKVTISSMSFPLEIFPNCRGIEILFEVFFDNFYVGRIIQTEEKNNSGCCTHCNFLYRTFSGK